METTQALATLLYSAMTLIEVGLLQLPLPLKQQLHFEDNLRQTNRDHCQGMSSQMAVVSVWSSGSTSRAVQEKPTLSRAPQLNTYPIL